MDCDGCRVSEIFRTYTTPSRNAFAGMPARYLVAFYEANTDIRAATAQFKPFNQEWPLRTASYPDPPAKFAFDEG
jgi:hypothetical protein